MCNPLKTENVTTKCIYKSGVWANKHTFIWYLILRVQALPTSSKLNSVKEHSWAWKVVIHTVESSECSQNSFHLSQVAFSPNNSHLNSQCASRTVPSRQVEHNHIVLHDKKCLCISTEAALSQLASCRHLLQYRHCLGLQTHTIISLCSVRSANMYHLPIHGAHNISASNVSYLTKQGFLASRKGNPNLVSFLDVFSTGSQPPFHV